MDFRQIKQFVVLATELNYRKAAERLHMTQPPLSIAIKRLETEIGAELFERDRQGVRLTVAGIAFLDEARRLLDGAESALQAARDAAQGRVGALRICSVPSAALNLLPRILPAFSQRFPQVRLRLSSGSTVGILAQLQRGELDAALLVPPASGVPGIAMTPLGRERLALAVPAGHRLAGAGRPRWPSWTATRWWRWRIRTAGIRRRDRGGLPARGLSSARDAGVLACAGHAAPDRRRAGVAIVPEALRRIAIDNVAFVDLEDAAGEPLSYAVALAAHAEPANPAVRWFVDAAREALDENGDAGRQ